MWTQGNIHENAFLNQQVITKSPGGASRDRTDDPLLAKQMLSQLSYGPDYLTSETSSPKSLKMVGLAGFEPATPRLSSVCSNQLSYRPLGRKPRAEHARLAQLSSS